MADRDDLLDQADALMHRHRSFVARPPGHEAVTAAAETEEIPLLTEIVAAEELAPPSVDALLDSLRQELDNALSAWLVDVLPAAVANASQQILAELDAKTRSTLLPHLAEIVETHRARQVR